MFTIMSVLPAVSWCWETAERRGLSEHKEKLLTLRGQVRRAGLADTGRR